MKEGFTLPTGLITEDPAMAALAWANAFYIVKDALEWIRPIPMKLIRKEKVANLDEILLECDSALSIGENRRKEKCQVKQF